MPRLLPIAALALLLSGGDCAADPLRALLVGGGPDENSNAAQIESHVRFVAGLLLPDSRRRILFADGKPDNASVSYADDSAPGQARAALAFLMPNSGLNTPLLLHKPNLGARPDGPASREALRHATAELLFKGGEKPGAPFLFYFAGHGAKDDDAEQGAYCLWNEERLTVRDLAAEIARLPVKTPIVLVMAQCYSGGFADVLFHNGNAKSDAVPQNVAGFFAAQKDRTASGCGVETAAADYQDFSSYFFGALCGRDRFGKAVGGADFDGDGRVSLHEAFCYALSHDDSFDTPVCTSDAFLERFAPVADEEIFPLPYAEIRQAASAGQRAALDALSERLGLSGESRALTVYDRLTFHDPVARPAAVSADRQAADELSALRTRVLPPFLLKWPGLRWTQSDGFSTAADGAAEQLTRDPGLAAEVVAAGRAHDAADEALDDEEAHWIRFANLCRSVARAHHLRDHGSEQAKARFARLWEAENATLPLVITAPPAR